MPNPGASRLRALRNLAVQFLAALIAFSGAIPLNASSPAESALNANDTLRKLAFQRQYEASAFITLFSVPIFCRSGVGFGFAGVDEQTRGAEQSFSLRFLSGSTPERAHGLNRFGFIQENVQQHDRATIAVEYFGLMTASAEDSFNDAKAALNARISDRVPFVASRAIIGRDETHYSVRHLLLPASYGGSNAGQLLRQVEDEFATPQPDQIEKIEVLNGQPIGTFLFSLRQAIQADADSFESRIIFNGKTLQLLAAKHLDAKVGSELQKAGATALPKAIVQLNGTLRNEKTKEVTSFRLWFEQGASNFLPLRFEFKPKSYLRLVFDAQPPPTEALMVNRELPQ